MKILVVNDREPISPDTLTPLTNDFTVVLHQASPGSFDLLAGFSANPDTEILVTTYMPLSAENLKRLPQLKLIVATTTAVEYIDLDYCKEQGIKVVNNTGYTESAVAEHLFSLMLAAGRKLGSLNKGVQAGDFEQFDKPGFEFNGKTLGIIGFGYIGQKLAQFASALGMTIIYSNRSAKPSAYQQVELNDLLKQADVIALTLPLTPDSEHLLDSEAFNNMKSSVIIASISADKIIDEDALIEAIKRGQVFAAGLDLHHPSNRLSQFDNVILTPTKAWYTKECFARRNQSWIKNLIKTVRQL